MHYIPAGRLWFTKKPRGYLPEVLVLMTLKHLEAAPRFELGIKDLQSSALPLGYAATKESITTRILSVKAQKSQKIQLGIETFS